MSIINTKLPVTDRKLKEARDYWISKWPSSAVTSTIKPDFDRTGFCTAQRDFVEIDLSGQLYEDLTKLTDNSPFLLHTTLITALTICLHKYTGRKLVAIGTPVLKDAARPNAVMIINDIDDQMSARRLLSQVRETLLEAYAKQDYPIDRLIKDLGFDGSQDRCPLFGVAMSLTDIHCDMPEMNQGITIEHANEIDKVAGRIEFSADLYRRETIERFAVHLKNALRQVVKDPQKQIRAFDLMTQGEREQVLVEWNNTKSDYPRQICLHHLFEAQVERTPNRIALVYEQQQLSYRELNGRANKLARYLIAAGVRREGLVGISVERSIEMVVGLIGIMKAGAAYVALDGGYPAQRLSYMIEDAQLKILLTSQHMAEALSGLGARVICLDDILEEVDEQSEENIDSGVMPENLAYVIYTSGSTGRPKGTMITHRGLVNYLSWCMKAYKVSEGQGAPVHSSIGFDLTVTSLFSPLMVGRSAVLLREEESIQRLSQALSRGDKFSLVKITPAHLEALSHMLMWSDKKIKARMLVIGGEALMAESLEFWRRSAPHTRFINEYGPTETVVGCCVYEVRAEELAGAVPIGRPIANTQMYLLDEHLNPVPVGVTGEIYIGGDGLARGYLNRLELTAEKFLPNPFSKSAGCRLYKTGDLGRYLADGNIEFLGRRDQQVKIRGYRIELGEIEAVLSQHEIVREVVVEVREDKLGQKRLVAFVVCKQETTAGTKALQRYVQDRLPEYMNPSKYVLMETMPLTPNGKIDRRALPAVDEARPDLFDDYIKPSTPTQEILVNIWSTLLNVERVGISDSFFRSGRTLTIRDSSGVEDQTGLRSRDAVEGVVRLTDNSATGRQDRSQQWRQERNCGDQASRKQEADANIICAAEDVVFRSTGAGE